MRRQEDPQEPTREKGFIDLFEYFLFFYDINGRVYLRIINTDRKIIQGNMYIKNVLLFIFLFVFWRI